jgi:hypothetical protein
MQPEASHVQPEASHVHRILAFTIVIHRNIAVSPQRPPGLVVVNIDLRRISARLRISSYALQPCPVLNHLIDDRGKIQRHGQELLGIRFSSYTL